MTYASRISEAVTVLTAFEWVETYMPREVGPLNYGKALKASKSTMAMCRFMALVASSGTNNRALVDAGAIVVGRKGNVGSLKLLAGALLPSIRTCFTSLLKMRLFLFLALDGMNFISSDTAVPGLNRTYAIRFQCLYRNADLLRAFGEQDFTLFDQIHAPGQSEHSSGAGS